MKNSGTNYGEFITIYNEIDEFMRKELNLSQEVSHTELINKISRINKIFAYYKNNLISFARLRNAIVHNPDKRDAEPIADPHDHVVKKYRDVYLKVSKPARALDTIAVKNENIYTANLDDKALDIMSKMKMKTFTHVPIIEDGELFGVFSENTIFAYIAEKLLGLITVWDIAGYHQIK